jgi:hypothetical protein
MARLWLGCMRIASSSVGRPARRIFWILASGIIGGFAAKPLNEGSLSFEIMALR